MDRIIDAIIGLCKRYLGRVFVWAVLVLLFLVMLFPLWVILVNSLAGKGEISAFFQLGEYQLLRFWQFPPNGMSYYDVLVGTPAFLKLFWNSCILTFPAVLIQVAVSTLAGYGFAKFDFPHRKAIFTAFIVVMMMPTVVTMVPNYRTIDFLGLMDSYAGVVLPGAFGAFGTFLMRQYISGIPTSVLEAARSDGAGELRIFFGVVLPLSKSGVAALCILTMIDLWNQIELPSLLLSGAEKLPLAVYLSTLSGINTGSGFACGMLFALPVLLIFFAGSDYLADGIEHSQF